MSIIRPVAVKTAWEFVPNDAKSEVTRLFELADALKVNRKPLNILSQSDLYNLSMLLNQQQTDNNAFAEYCDKHDISSETLDALVTINDSAFVLRMLGELQELAQKEKQNGQYAPFIAQGELNKKSTGFRRPT